MAPAKAKKPEPEPEPQQPQAPVPVGGDDQIEECVDRIDEQGHGVIWYPSGNIAVNMSIGDVSKGGLPIRQAIFMADSRKPVMLMSFDQNGEGFVNYSNGKPWLIVSRLTGYQVSDKQGNITAKGTWPRKDSTPIICNITDSMTVEFIDRQNITATFSLLNVNREFEVGERLKRTDTYLDKSKGTSPISTLRGKHELDVAEIRRALDERGSLYHRPGPHATPTKVSGVGVLRTLTKELHQECEAIKIMGGLEDAMQRMVKVNTLPGATLSKTAHEPLDDMGSPPLSENLKTLRRENFARRVDLKNWYNICQSKYTPRRKKFPSISLAKYHEVTSTAPPSRMLVVVCFHADWSPMSRKHQGPIEEVWGELQEAASKDSNCAQAMVQIYRLDASEASEVQKKYDFRNVPMYFHFFDGNLVAATNAFRGKEDFIQRIKQSQENGSRGIFLPSSFTFGLRDNFELDHINSNMQMLGM